MGANRRDDKETLLKLFSGAAPDKFSLCKMVRLFKKVGRPQCGAANIGVEPNLTSPIFTFPGIFFKCRRMPGII
jgi:hypothetical protein